MTHISIFYIQISYPVFFLQSIKAIVVICLFGLLYACGGASDSSLQPSGQRLGTENPLRVLSFTGSVLQVQQRLVAYSKKTGRVSLIDPLAKREIWSREVAANDFAVKLPELDTVAMFKPNSVTILGENSQRVFDLSVESAHITIAENAAAYSFSSADGRSVEVLRSLGNGVWEHEVFTVPWPAQDPDLLQAPDGQPVLLGSQFNNAGSSLTVFSPADGRYAVYSSNSVASPLAYTGSWCPGDGVGLPNNASFRSIAWDESMQVFYVGDREGRVYVLEPNEPCVDFSARPMIQLNTGIPVTAIAVYGSGKLGAIQIDRNAQGQRSVHTLKFDGSNVSVETSEFSNVCDLPLGSIILNPQYLLIMCAVESNLPEVLSQPVPIATRIYLLADMSNGEVAQQIIIDKNSTAGVAIDQERLLMYRMREGAFGNLESIDLRTASVTVTPDLYLNGLLD